jgi:hypothetical protein
MFDDNDYCPVCGYGARGWCGCEARPAEERERICNDARANGMFDVPEGWAETVARLNARPAARKEGE